MDMRRTDYVRWIAIAAVVLLAAIFAYLNGNDLTTLNFGFAVLYQVSLVGIVFISFLLGMVTMFVLGLRHDLRVRRALRDHHLTPTDRPLTEEPRPPPEPPM
jgi:uncharacterized integral membrane protein